MLQKRQQLERQLQVLLCSFFFFFGTTGLLVFKLNISVASSVFNSMLEETFHAKATFKVTLSWTLSGVS